MDPTTKEPSTATANLIAERLRVWDAMQGIQERTDGRVWSPEELKAYEQLEAEMDGVEKSIASVEAGMKMKARLEAPADSPVPTTTRSSRPDPASADMSGRDVSLLGKQEREHAYERAFDTYLRSGPSGLSPNQQAVLQANYTDISELRADQSLTSAQGGYTVPPGFVTKITDTLKLYGGMLQTCNVLTTDSGQPLQWPTADDTGTSGVLLAENTAPAVVGITFGTKTLGAFMYSSSLVRVSFQLLNDSAFNLNDWLTLKLGQRIGRIINNHFTLGTGAGAQPVGLIPNASVGKQGIVGQTTTVIYDDLVDLIHSVDPAYRHVSVDLNANPNGAFGPNAGWMMNDGTLKVVRKLKDSQGHPLWEPSVQIGMPSTLLGYPVALNQDMVVPAASAKTIAFGDFHAAYVIRQVIGFQMLRLNERYADALQVGFMAFARFDGNTDDLNAVKLYQHSAT